MKKQCKWIWYAVWALICLVGGGGTLFSWMPRTPAMFYGGFYTCCELDRIWKKLVRR